MKAWRDRESCKGETVEEVSRWIRVIHRNTTATAIKLDTAGCRKRSKEIPLYQNLRGDSDKREIVYPDTRAVMPDFAAEIRDLVECVKANLTKLTDLQRRAVELRFLKQMKIGEVAEEMQLSRMAVESLVKRGLESLRSLMA
jgi:RNA polymerase sigma factor (sigma-70 family)